MMNFNEMEQKKDETKVSDTKQKQYRLIDIILGLRSEYLRIQDELNDIMDNIDVNTNSIEKIHPTVRNKGGNIVLEFIYVKKQNKVSKKLLKMYQRFPWAVNRMPNCAYIQKDENGKYQISPNISNIVNQERFHERLSKVLSFKFLGCTSHVGEVVSQDTVLYITENNITLSDEFGWIDYYPDKDIICYTKTWYTKYDKENHFLESFYMNIPEDKICDYFKETISKGTKKELIIPRSVINLIEENSESVKLRIVEDEQKVRLMITD